MPLLEGQVELAAFPLVADFQQNGANQSQSGTFIGENTDDARPAPDFAV